MKDMNFIDIRDVKGGLLNAVKSINHVLMERDQLYAVLTWFMLNTGTFSVDMSIEDLQNARTEYTVRFLPGEEGSSLRMELVKNEE